MAIKASKPINLINFDTLAFGKNFKESLEASYQLLFDYLTKRDSMVVRKQKTKGLGLPKEVLEKIFSKNYLNFLADTK